MELGGWHELSHKVLRTVHCVYVFYDLSGGLTINSSSLHLTSYQMSVPFPQVKGKELVMGEVTGLVKSHAQCSVQVPKEKSSILYLHGAATQAS